MLLVFRKLISLNLKAKFPEMQFREIDHLIFIFHFYFIIIPQPVFLRSVTRVRSI